MVVVYEKLTGINIGSEIVRAKVAWARCFIIVVTQILLCIFDITHRLLLHQSQVWAHSLINLSCQLLPNWVLVPLYDFCVLAISWWLIRSFLAPESHLTLFGDVFYFLPSALNFACQFLNLAEFRIVLVEQLYFLGKSVPELAGNTNRRLWRMVLTIASRTIRVVDISPVSSTVDWLIGFVSVMYQSIIVFSVLNSISTRYLHVSPINWWLVTFSPCLVEFLLKTIEVFTVSLSNLLNYLLYFSIRIIYILS